VLSLLSLLYFHQSLSANGFQCYRSLNIHVHSFTSCCSRGELIDFQLPNYQPTHRTKSELLYDWRFTANHFILAPKLLRLTSRDFFQLNPWGHSPYVKYSLMRGWVCLIRMRGLFSCVRITHIPCYCKFFVLYYTSPLSVLALQRKPTHDVASARIA
jgi:hypothetical protein